jgi:energy-coupling factor transporter ATP-binding protein EcfA2
MFGFNRLPQLISLAAASVLVAISVVVNLLTTDKPLPLRELFSWERRYFWLVLIALVVVSVVLTPKGSDTSQSDQKEKKSRQRLLEQVGNQIDNFAPRPSLKKKIPLRWQKCPDLEVSSTNDAGSKDHSRTLLSFGIDEVEYFLKNLGVGATLLILGDRGAGKSTTLKELAQALLSPPNVEMPVRLSLPDWERYCKIAKSRSSRTIFQDWVIPALTQSPYKIDKEIITPWLDGGQLTLLLDGLDELSNPSWCQKCVDDINQFRQKNSLTSIIICCQSQAYAELRSPLKVEQAFCIRPLELEQIEAFLNQPGEDFSKVRDVYRAMRQKFRTPLDLNVLAFACQELDLQELHGLLEGEGWYSRFWKHYIQRMFQQRKASSRYTEEKVQKWLCWLAQKMQTKSQYAFGMEQLQPSWFDNRLQKILYWSICKMLNSCKIFLLCICFLGELFLSMMIPMSIFMKPIYNNLTVMVIRLYSDPIYERIYDFLIKIYPPNPIITKEIFLLFAIILISGITIFLIIEFIYLIYLVMETPEEKVRPVEKWKFLVPGDTQRHYLGVIFLVVVFSSPLLWLFWQVPQLNATLVPGAVLLIPGSAIVLSIIASGIFFLGVMLLMDFLPNSIKIDEFKISRKNHPNQGIFNSVNNSIKIGLLFSCFGSILFGLGGWFLWGFNHGIGIGILGALFFGIANSLEHGSTTFIPHIALRLILNLSNLTPWKYRSFLDYAVRLRFLKKEGGAYAFIDPSLQEYFAEMNSNGSMKQQ